LERSKRSPPWFHRGPLEKCRLLEARVEDGGIILEENLGLELLLPRRDAMACRLVSAVVVELGKKGNLPPLDGEAKEMIRNVERPQRAGHGTDARRHEGELRGPSLQEPRVHDVKRNGRTLEHLGDVTRLDVQEIVDEDLDEVGLAAAEHLLHEGNVHRAGPIDADLDPRDASTVVLPTA